MLWWCCVWFNFRVTLQWVENSKIILLLYFGDLSNRSLCFPDGCPPLCPKYNLQCFLYTLFRWAARAINFCDRYLMNIWSSICVLYLCDWRSLWPSFRNLMLWYPLFSICLLILLLEDTHKYFHDLMPVFNQIDWKGKYLLSSCGTDTSEVRFSTIYGRSFRALNGEGLRYDWDWVVPRASLQYDLRYRMISQ